MSLFIIRLFFRRDKLSKRVVRGMRTCYSEILSIFGRTEKKQLGLLSNKPSWLLLVSQLFKSANALS